jgi:acyl-coenzyme A thioesterase PaaI-like protein
MPSLREFLCAEQLENNAWRFHVPRELHGAFGGAFGGVVAAATIVTARSVAEGRTPNALDCRFVRGLRAGDAVATATVINAGRTLSTVSVDLTDEEGRLCTRATISLVDREALKRIEREAPRAGDWKTHAEATKWPPVAPIVEAIDSRFVGEEGREFSIAVIVPWDVSPHDSAEAACLAADMAVGAPAGYAGAREKVSTPNPDLSLRFFGDVTTSELVGVGRLERATNGVAAIGLEVWSDRQMVATGISTALLIPAG